jgi:hypothetical protein
MHAFSAVALVTTMATAAAPNSASAANILQLAGVGIVTRAAPATWISNPSSAPYLDLGALPTQINANHATFNYNGIHLNSALTGTTIGDFLVSAPPPGSPPSDISSIDYYGSAQPTDSVFGSFFQFQGFVELTKAPTGFDYFLKINHDDGFDFKLTRRNDPNPDKWLNPIVHLSNTAAFGPSLCADAANAFNNACFQTFGFNIPLNGFYDFSLSYGSNSQGDNQNNYSRLDATIIPTPASITLFGFGVFAMGMILRQSRARTQADAGATGPLPA